MQLTQPFEISFTCEDVAPDVCRKAKAGFESAGARIASALHIYSPLRVNATFKSFCKGNLNGCELRDTLGQAASAAYFAARPEQARNWYFYPQGLIKQLRQDYQLQFNEFDIIAEFNADFKFWFKNDSTPIRPDQTDFEFVVTHELTHGLGFDTAWAQWAQLWPTLANQRGYLAPLFHTQGSSPENAIVTAWQPLIVFDRYVLESTTSRTLTTQAQNIFRYNPGGSRLMEFIRAFERSGDPFSAAEYVFQIITSGSKAIKFKASDGGDDILLHTATNKYQPGTSIAHVDYDTYWQTPDFLMIPAVQNLTGITLDDIIARNSGNGTLPTSGVYGPRTVALLETMGWPTPKNPGQG
ncbi:hypothetical protein HK102_010110, partial [Quaeritorhiza haematococci]